MSVVKQFTLAEVGEHNKPNDLWVVIEDNVYNLTEFRSEHPGGEDTLDEAGGRDATREFLDVGHSSEARLMMKKYFIGELAQSDRQQQLPIRKISTAVIAVIVGYAAILILKKVLRSTK